MLRLRQYLYAAAVSGPLAALSCTSDPRLIEPQKDGAAVQTPSVWERKSWEGTVPRQDQVNGIGILEFACTATALDVMVDFSNSNIALPAVFPPISAAGPGISLEIYTFSGNLQLIKGAGVFAPSGIDESIVPIDLQARVTQDGNRFLVQVSGNIALGWGIRAAAVSSASTPIGVTGLWIGAIAHGVEVLGD